MFPLKKSVSVLFSILILLQQGAFAYPLESALRRDYARFRQPDIIEASGEAVSLPAESYKRLEKFKSKTSGSWKARLNRADGTPRALVGKTGLSVGKTESGAMSFINKNKDFLGVDRKQIKLKLQRKSAVGTHFYFDQYYKGLKVETSYVKVNVDNNGELLNYQSTFAGNLDIDTKPSMAPAEAATAAAADTGGTALGAAQQVIYPDYINSAYVLAWKVTVQGGPSEPGRWTYYVKDSDGAILNRVSNLMYLAESFTAKLNPVHPGFTDADIPVDNDANRPSLPLTDLEVYYFQSSGSDVVTTATTNASGQITTTSRTGRMFAGLTSKYFNITNQRNLPNGNVSGYYVERGTDPGALFYETEVLSAMWSGFSPTGNNTYSACPATGDYPLFTAPTVRNMNVGAMDIFGVITDKVFLYVTATGTPAANQILGKYIGRPGNDFLGPIVANNTKARTVSTSLNPSGSTGTYDISDMQRLCLPIQFTINSTTSNTYNPISNHIVATSGVNEAEANAYYNLTEMRKFFVNLNTGNYINLDNPLPVIVNAHGQPYSANNGSGMPNAFFDIDHKVLMLGEGIKASTKFKNFALESPIVRHEYVHAVMDNIWPVMYFGEGAAIAEAVSDYFALSSLKKADGTPYTSKVGAYVSVTGSTGEAAVRNLSVVDDDSTFDPSRWAGNAFTNYHKNSLVLSRALWDLRTGVRNGGANKLNDGDTDKVVWNALMFFPDSLLEFRDAMVSAAGVLSVNTVKIEAAFNENKITFNDIITTAGDIYEPNNSPGSAADIDYNALSSKELFGAVNPASDMDYYSISLAPGDFEAKLYLPRLSNRPNEFYPFSIVLLDAEMKTVVDVQNPSLVGGQGNQTTLSEYVTLKYTVPARIDGFSKSSRYILGIFKPDEGAYPDTVTAETGKYRLVLKLAQGSNVGGVTTNIPAFADGTLFDFKVPYSDSREVNNNSIPGVLSDWAPNHMEAFSHARLLDEDLKPITGASTIDNTYLEIIPDPMVDPVNKLINGQVRIAGGFEALGHEVIYLQVFGKLRSNVSGTNTDYREDYGIVSLGISSPIRNRVASNKALNIRNAVINPAKGGIAKIDVNPKKDGRVSVKLFTVDGMLVKTVYEGPGLSTAPLNLTWDGRNSNGNMVASGVYLVRVDGAGISKEVRKIVVVK